MPIPTKWKRRTLSAAVGVTVTLGLPGVAAAQTFGDFDEADLFAGLDNDGDFSFETGFGSGDAFVYDGFADDWAYGLDFGSADTEFTFDLANSGFDDAAYAPDFGIGGDAGSAYDDYSSWGYLSEPWSSSGWAGTWGESNDHVIGGDFRLTGDYSPWGYLVDLLFPHSWAGTWGRPNHHVGWGMEHLGSNPGVGVSNPGVGVSNPGVGVSNPGVGVSNPGDGVSAEILQLTNSARAGAGCAPLTLNPQLSQAATAHSQDMANRNYFDHFSPEGASPGDRIAATGYQSSSWAENIAGDFSDAQSVMAKWMESPGHRANIVNCGLTELGVGYATNPTTGRALNWTQVFASPRG